MHYVLRSTKLINSIWNKDELPQQWKELFIVPIYEKDDKTDCSNYRGMSLLSNTYKILHIVPVLSLILHVDKKLLGIIIVNFYVIAQVLIR
jgi:hypothetical protein